MFDNEQEVGSAAWLEQDGTWIPVPSHSHYREYAVNFRDGLVRYYQYGIELGCEFQETITRQQRRAIYRMIRKHRPRSFALDTHMHSDYGMTQEEFISTLRKAGTHA